MILATKSHAASVNRDIDLFTDADLSVLGAAPETYAQYAAGVRKEYSMYPDLHYKPGRRKVLKHFLEMDRIFKTDEFFQLYEKQARENLLHELASR
jgi:predicted metal-dependent HD superfamily phosphohydrolase